MPKHSCPEHGTEHIVKEGTACYCAFPTPGEKFSKCFYHPTGKPHDLHKEDNDVVEPDVMKALFTGGANYRIRKSKNAQRMRESRSLEKEK